MNLLLDMGLAPRTADFLRGLGHDAVHLRERGLQRLADRDIVRLALAEGRVIATFDLDFSRILALGRLAQPSVILFRLEQFSTDEINRTLEDILMRFDTELQSGAIVVIDPQRVRVRRLPFF